MKRIVPFLAVVCASGALAQAPTTPPKVIQLYREEVKPARSASHTAVEAGYAKLWAKYGAKPFLAMTAASGPGSDVLFISSYQGGWAAMDEDMAAFEKGSADPEFAALSKQESELVSSVRIAIATYREDLSYNPGKLMEQLPKARWVWIRTMRTKYGHEQDFAEMAKMNAKAHADAKMDEAWAVYQVRAGAQAGTFLAFMTSRSFAEEDAMVPTHKAMREAAGPEFAAKMKKHAEDDLAFDQWDVWALNPRMSHVSKEFAAADAGFWTPKPATAPAAKKVATKKEEPKK